MSEPSEKCPACQAVRCRLFEERWCCVSCRRVWSQAQIDAFYTGTLRIEPQVVEPSLGALDDSTRARDILLAALDHGCQPSHCTLVEAATRAARMIRIAFGRDDVMQSATAMPSVQPFTRAERKALSTAIHMARNDGRITDDHCTKLEALVDSRSVDRGGAPVAPAVRITNTFDPSAVLAWLDTPEAIERILAALRRPRYPQPCEFDPSSVTRADDGSLVTPFPRSDDVRRMHPLSED